MNTSNLSYQFKTANVLIKLILINVLVFLCFLIIPWIFKINPGVAMRWFSLPSSLGEFILQPWSILTYAFLHAGFWHIFWNMLILYWFGTIVLNLFQGKRFLTIYLLGAIAGGALFVITYNLFPVFENVKGAAILVGASAAVRAIMIFIATYSPNTEVRVIFFNVKLWHIAVFVLLSDLIQIPSSANAGGLVAHLGGAIFGYAYGRQLLKGNDIGAGWERLVDNMASFFKKKEKSSRMKTVYRNANTTKQGSKSDSRPSRSEQQRKIDNILDKISKSGYDSLSKAEKDFLFKAGKDS
ncbi:MAG TPA: rhomboid family intramembrane serine protease [Leeuwenhoekiella sp.]|nr:rhomboid family intramembrane serine protease [Leeuwenhoekiella sp.]